MKTMVSEGTLAARVRALQLLEPEGIWRKVQLSPEISGHRTPQQSRVGRRRRALIALVAATLLVLLGGTALAVTSLTRPAVVHGKPTGQSSQGGFDAHMGWPGHPVKVSVDEASRLTGFRVLTLESLPSARLNSIEYVPMVVPANQPARMGGGTVTLDYTVDGTEVQINEHLDPNPSAPFEIDQKVPPGSANPLCTTVETINGGEYIFSRCPDGQTINAVFWKTLDGVDISLAPVITSRPKGSPPQSLPMPLVQSVIDHLR